MDLTRLTPSTCTLLTKDHKRNPKICWEEFLHCTFHERLPFPFHLGLLHSCLAFACPNFHGLRGPTRKPVLQNRYDTQIIICVPKNIINKYLNWQDSQSLKTSKDKHIKLGTSVIPAPPAMSCLCPITCMVWLLPHSWGPWAAGCLCPQVHLFQEGCW